MPQISYHKGGGKITYNHLDWLGGYDTSSAGFDKRKLQNALAFVENVDPIRVLGYLGLGSDPGSATDVASINAYLRNAVMQGDEAYAISGGDTVQKIGTLTGNGAVNTTAPFPHTIDHGHSNETGLDIVNYYNGATQKAFYSFKDDTDWDIGAYNYTTDSFDDDFMSTVPADAADFAAIIADGKDAPHPLQVGDDDVLYMGDRNMIHAYDGQVGGGGTFYEAVLTLPVGWFITGMCKMKGPNLAIAAYYSSSGSATASQFARRSSSPLGALSNGKKRLLNPISFCAASAEKVRTEATCAFHPNLPT